MSSKDGWNRLAQEPLGVSRDLGVDAGLRVKVGVSGGLSADLGVGGQLAADFSVVNELLEVAGELKVRVCTCIFADSWCCVDVTPSSKLLPSKPRLTDPEKSRSMNRDFNVARRHSLVVSATNKHTAVGTDLRTTMA